MKDGSVFSWPNGIRLLITFTWFCAENLQRILDDRQGPGFHVRVVNVAGYLQPHNSAAELPVVEFIASIAYRIAGGEHLWIPRLMSSIFWLIGGAFLYLFVKKIISADAAVFSTTFYLFLPYGIIASRSFQPNPLMIMLLIISIWRIFCYYEQPSMRRLLIAAGLSASAFFIYPTSVFFIFGAFVFLAFYRYGVWRAIINSKFWLFAVITLLPTIIYYAYLIFIMGFLKDYAGGAFLPQILLRSFFWKGWLNQIEKVVGLAALVGALLGILEPGTKFPRPQTSAAVVV